MPIPSPPDLHLFAAGPFDDAASPTGGAFGVVTALLSPSSTGTVRLRSADPDDPPRIEVAHLRTADDLRRMVDAARHARRLARTPPLADFVQGALVDSTGAVHGTDGLWVADASVIPSLLGVNPNSTAMVVGDRIASWLLDQ